MMVLNRTRFAVVVLGDRLVAAALDRGGLQTFVVDAEDASAALRAELGARKLRPRTVALGLARASVTVKPIELPEVGGELRDMVRFDLERHLPFSADDAPFDFVPLPRERDGTPTPAGNRRVLIVAADRRVIDSALRLVQEANLRLLSITVAAHDLQALVVPPRNRRVVWMHKNGDTVDLLFLVGSNLALSRNFPAADDESIVAEIKRTFPVVRWRGCDAIWKSGDDAVPESPTTSPLTELGAPVTAPPYHARARRALAEIDADARGARELAVAVAMARRSRALDLIPPAMRPRRLTRAQIVTIGSAAAAVILGLAALLVPGYRDRQRLQTLNAQIARLDPEVRSVERLLGDLERKRKLLATIESLDANAIKPLPVLRELTDLLPNDSWLTLLSLDAKGIELTGQAAAASNLIPLLENSPRFERVEFASPVTRGRDREQFRIVAKWEAPPGRLTEAPTAPPPPPAAAAPTPAVPAAPSARPPAPGPQKSPRAAVPGNPGLGVEVPPAASESPRRISPSNLPGDGR